MRRAAAVLMTLLLPSVAAAQNRDTTHARRAQSGEASERALRAAEVPAPVRAAFQHAYPHATVRGYSTEVENGRRIYEVESREGSVGRDVSFGADGSVLEVEETVAMTQLPAAVRDAITRQAAGAAVTRAERVVAAGDTTYEFKIRGRRGEVKLKADGTAAPNEP